MATLTRLVSDLEVAEDAVQEACVVALDRWPVEGVPANPGAWLVGVARHKAIDRMRRESRRQALEAAAMAGLHSPDDQVPSPSASSLPWPRPSPESSLADDELALVFLCCHPALDRSVRVALTLRSVCGLSTSEIAAAFLVSEPTMAKRLLRAKHKIRQARIPFRIPASEALGGRIGDVLRVVFLVFTEGHTATTGPHLVRGELCDTAIGLARALVTLLPNEPEVTGLLALLLLTDARRASRSDASGALVLLADQDRRLWDTSMIAEGDALVEQALCLGRPGPYQLWAAIAACHSGAACSAATDWHQISALYRELHHFEPTPVVEANRAIAVAMAEGPAAGLAILDGLATHAQLRQWHSLHVARADLLVRLGRRDEALDAYHLAKQCQPSMTEGAFINRRIEELAGN